MRTSPFVAATTALLLAFTASGADGQQPGAGIDRIFSFATADTPGCAVGVSQNGKVVANGTYGLAEVESRRPLTTNSKFDIGSVQKQFTAAAVLALVQDGRLSLTDDIRKYLPELPDYGHKVTLDHLLTNTSGMRDWSGLLPLAEEGLDVMTLIVRQRGLNFAPGEEWSYSSSGFEVAKAIVARVSGMSFAEFTRRRLFEPLGMTSSAYVPDIMQGEGERAVGYQKNGAVWKRFMRLGNERGGGAVISTAGDLLRWNDALTNGRLGKVVTEKLHEPTRLRNGRTLKYARALMLDSIPGGRLVSHDGGAYGFSAWLGRFTEANLSVVVLCNFDPVSATQLAGRVADLYLPPVDPKAQPPGPVAAPGVDVNPRAGLYFDSGTGEAMRLLVNRDRLSIVGGPPLVAVSAERFRPQRASFFYRSQDEFELTFRSSDEFELKSMEGKTALFRRAQPWSPTPADLQGIDGRYQNPDIGTVFEIIPSASTLTFRFERAPEKSLEYQAVAPNTWMRNTGIIRFRRDASGKVTGFVYTSPELRNLTMTRLGDRAATSPSTTSATASVPLSPAPPLDRLVGQYEMAPGRALAITLENGQLHGEPAGSTKQPLIHVSGATFAVGHPDAPVRVTFTLGEDGRATGMIMKQGTSERTLQRLP